MKRVKFCFIALLCCAHLMAYADKRDSAVPSALQASQKQGVKADLLVENGQVKSTIPGIKVSAGYLKLTNNSNETICFVGAKTPAARHTEFHRMVMHDGRMAMRKVDMVEIKAKQSFEFNENGYHLMFMGLKQQFKPGESISLTLIDDNGKAYELLLPIVAVESH